MQLAYQVRYLDRGGTIRAIQHFAITAFSTYIIHRTVLFRVYFPNQNTINQSTMTEAIIGQASVMLHPYSYI